MMMIHDPMVCLAEPANAEQLGKLIEMLKPVKASIVAAYKERCKLSEKELETMMKTAPGLLLKNALPMASVTRFKVRLNLFLTAMCLWSTMYGIS